MIEFRLFSWMLSLVNRTSISSMFETLMH